MIRDRLSFMRFLGLGVNEPVPDATTIWLFRQHLQWIARRRKPLKPSRRANIELNSLTDRVRGYCVARTDRTMLSVLRMNITGTGSAFHSFGEDTPGGFHQGMIGHSIDDLQSAFDLPGPDYIKIDVDGIEGRIIAGAAVTLADPGVRGLLIEIAESNRGTDCRHRHRHDD